MAGPITSIYEQDVLPAVAIVVKKSAARAERFRQQLAAVGSIIVPEADSSLGGDVRKSKPGIILLGRGRCKSVQ